MKRLGMHRVDGRSYWFGGYFNPFDRERMVRYGGEARARRFDETFGGRVPFADARLARVYDPDPEAARQFADTFGVEVAGSPEAFAEGLDGVIVPFPAGGPARDYGAVRPLVEQGIPLFLDRIILEQSDSLGSLCRLADGRRAPLHITCFLRYVAELLRPAAGAEARTVTVSSGGEPNGYGADLLDLVDALMDGDIRGVRNDGDAARDLLTLRYADGRTAVLELLHHEKRPMQVAVRGDGWERSLVLDGTQNHRAAFLQFEAFLASLETRTPPVPYARIRAQAAVLHAAEQRVYGRELAVDGPQRTAD